MGRLTLEHIWICTLPTFSLLSIEGVLIFGGVEGGFVAFQSMLTSDSGWGSVRASVGVVNWVVAFGYYGSVMGEILMKSIPDGDIARLTSVFGG